MHEYFSQRAIHSPLFVGLGLKCEAKRFNLKSVSVMKIGLLYFILQLYCSVILVSDTSIISGQAGVLPWDTLIKEGAKIGLAFLLMVLGLMFLYYAWKGEKKDAETATGALIDKSDSYKDEVISLHKESLDVVRANSDVIKDLAQAIQGDSNSLGKGFEMMLKQQEKVIDNQEKMIDVQREEISMMEKLLDKI